jgi:hypothetical protein
VVEAALDQARVVKNSGEGREPAGVVAVAATPINEVGADVMRHRISRLQQLLLDALRRHGRVASLESLAALAAGLIPNLDTRPPYGRAPARARYVAVARAVATLRRRGLVDARRTPTKRGRLEWQFGPVGRLRPVWRFSHPGTRLWVRAIVDSLAPKT